MGFKVVEPGERSIEPVEVKMPVLPREEAHRIRRASRAFADTLLPLAMRNLAEALEAEDWEVKKWATDKVLKMTITAIPNEATDPETSVVDGTVASKDALAALEKETETGTGLPDE